MDSKKKIFWSCFSLLLAVLTILAVLLRSGDLSLGELINDLKEADPRWTAAAILSTVLYIFLEGVAVCTILRGLGYKKHLGRGLLYSTSDIYFSAITPSATGGQPASAYFLIKDGIPAGVVTVTLIVNTIMYTAGIIVLGIISIVLDHNVFFGFRPLGKILIILGFLALAGVICFWLVVLRKGHVAFNSIRKIIYKLHEKHLIRKVDRKLKKIDKSEVEYGECVTMMAGKTKTIIAAFLLNLLQRTCQVLVPVFMYLALGGNGKTARSVFSAQCLVTLGYSCVPIPGAMGVADFLMIDGFKSLMERQTAFHLEMLSRGISFYVCVIVSGLITAAGYVLLKMKCRKDSEDT
ncbi:MAG: flippase-like domain-containing protein [Clostridiales bacterium]|nr:flippase-like domain-containing protein [Clostridiales bacterium]